MTIEKIEVDLGDIPEELKRLSALVEKAFSFTLKSKKAQARDGVALPPEMVGTSADPVWLRSMWIRAERRARIALDRAGAMTEECVRLKHKHASLRGQKAWQEVEEKDRKIAELNKEVERLGKLLEARSYEVDRLDEARMRHAGMAAQLKEQIMDRDYAIRALQEEVGNLKIKIGQIEKTNVEGKE